MRVPGRTPALPTLQLFHAPNLSWSLPLDWYDRKPIFLIDKSTFVPVPCQMETINEEIPARIFRFSSPLFSRPSAPRPGWMHRFPRESNGNPRRGGVRRRVLRVRASTPQGSPPFRKINVHPPLKIQLQRNKKPWPKPGFSSTEKESRARTGNPQRTTCLSSSS